MTVYPVLTTTLTRTRARPWADMNAADEVINAHSVALGAIATAFSPEQFGAAGDLVADDTAAVLACFAAANALKKVSGAYAAPGATVVLTGSYKLTTLAAPIDVQCNLVSVGATFTTPAGYTGVAVRVGHSVAGQIMENLDVIVPNVIGYAAANMAALPAGSVGVLLTNLYTSRVIIGRLSYFETPLQLGGKGHGVVYNEIAWRTISYGKVLVRLKALDAAGWVNQNTFIAGSLSGSSGWGGVRTAGARGIVFDGSTGNSVNGNSFYGTSIEGDVSEHAVEYINALQNPMYSTRFEQGTAPTAFTVAGATCTTAAPHGLAVGMALGITAAALPTGMNQSTAFYVVAVPTSTTFTLSMKLGGAAITFVGAGAGLTYLRPPSILYNGATWFVRENLIDAPYVGANKVLDQQFIGPAVNVSGNVIRYPNRLTVDADEIGDVPIVRVHNSRLNTVRPLLGFYPPGVNPANDPNAWTVAGSDRGLLLGDGTTGAELVRLFTKNASGVIYARKPADAIDYEVATCRRMPGGTVAITALVCLAGTTTTVDIAVAGAAVGDYALGSVTSALPSGLIQGQAVVPAADVVRLVFANVTAATINLTAAAHAIVFRQYF